MKIFRNRRKELEKKVDIVLIILNRNKLKAYPSYTMDDIIQYLNKNNIVVKHDVYY